MSKPISSGEARTKAVGGRQRTLDVRALISSGGNPLARIVATVAALRADEDFVLITPFLPSPMIEKLHAEGFAARPERRADGGWQTHFARTRSSGQ